MTLASTKYMEKFWEHFEIVWKYNNLEIHIWKYEINFGCVENAAIKQFFFICSQIWVEIRFKFRIWNRIDKGLVYNVKINKKSRLMWFSGNESVKSRGRGVSIYYILFRQKSPGSGLRSPFSHFGFRNRKKKLSYEIMFRRGMRKSVPVDIFLVPVVRFLCRDNI